MANQITINIGAAANDGTGDPLRTAFNDVNLNFANVWNTGLPSSNVQFSDNRILTVNTNANLVLAPNGIGKVVSNVDIVPSMANVQGLGSPARRWNSIYTQFLDVSSNVNFNNLNITGNLSVDGNIIYSSNVFVGDLEGSVLDGASSMVLDVVNSSIYVDNYYYANGAPFNPNSYSNANVAAYLPIYSGDLSAGAAAFNTLIVSGNAALNGNITSTGNLITTGTRISNGPAFFNGNTVANGATTFNGPVSHVGNLGVVGATTFTGPVTANGTTTFNGLVNHVGDVNVLGDLTANGTFTVNGPTFLANASLGALTFNNQVITGTNINGNITLAPEGSGTVIVPGIDISTGEITADNSNFNLVSKNDTDLVLSAGAGTILTGSDVLPTTHNAINLGSDTLNYNTLFLGTGGLDIENDVGNINVTLKAIAGNLVIGNASGLTVGDFTFYGNSLYINNPAQDFTIGTLGATGKVLFNRAIEVINANTTAPSFFVSRTGLTSVLVTETLSPTLAALNIIGTASGNVQPRNYSGTMLQITGQDNNSARVSIDAFGATSNTGGDNSIGSITARVARGTVNAPQQNLANDIMLRLAGQAWNEAGSFQGNIIRMNMLATENVTSTSAATRFNFQTVPVGSVTLQDVANIDSTGIRLLNSSNLTFKDNTVQTTAFNPANVVTSLTVGTGLTQTNTQGTVSINATGVQNVVGTTNQIIVSDSGGKNLTLSLPQSINTNSTVQFGNLTVGNLTVLGNTSAANVLVVNDKTLTLANNSTSASQINGGGIILGNVLNGSYYRTFLYDLNNDRWDTDGAGLKTLTLTSGNAYIETLWANNSGHFGGAFTGNTYTGAIIQGDSDVNSYAQIVNQNHSSGTDASADFVAVNDIGTDTNNYIDMGINSSTYSNPAYGITVANDGYVFVNGGNLAIGTQSAGKNIVFHTGGTTANRLRATITDTGLSVVGNVTATGIVATGNISAGNLNISGNLTVPFSSAVLTTGSQPNITSVGTLTSLSVAGNINAGNLRTVGQVSSTGNITTAASVNAATVSATGNITGANLIATGGEFSTTISASANITGGNLLTAGLISSTGTITSAANIVGGNVNSVGVVSATGNIRGANFNTAGLVSATGNVDGGNLRTGGIVIATGNITSAANVAGGNLLTSGIISATGAITSADGITGTTVSATGNVIGGNLVTAGTVSATGNISGNYFFGNGAFLSGLGATYSNATAASFLANFGSNTISTTGNVTAGNISGGNLLTTGVVSSTGNITSAANIAGGNLLTTGTVSAASHIGSVVSVTGNITGGNILTGGVVSSTGNITSAANITGGNLLTSGVVSAASHIGSIVSVTGNVSAANINLASNVYATYGTFGNIVVGNNSVYSLSGNTDVNIGLVSSTANVNINRTAVFAKDAFVTGNVSATGNITGSYILGNGSQLTGLPGPGSWLTGKLNINPASVGKTNDSVQTFTITGLTTAHKIIVQPAATLTYGIFITAAWCSATNTVSIQFMNVTGANIDLAAFDLTYMAWI